MDKFYKTSLGLALVIGVAGIANADEGTSTIVKDRGYLKCGTTTGTAGFAAPDENGVWQGIDVDFCRAVAAAVLGDSEAVRFYPMKSDQRFIALQSGETDIHVGTTSWTYSRDANGLTFSFPNFYTYSGVLAKSDSGISSMEDLQDTTVCLQSAGSTQFLVMDHSESNGLNLTPVLFDSRASLLQAFFADRCDSYITDATSLAALVASHTDDPDEFNIFPFANIQDAFAPATRHGDDNWSDIVKWTFQALLHAEDLGITSSNIDKMRETTDQKVRNILGVESGLGEPLGLDDDFVYNIVKQVGNYEEVFERNLGNLSPIRLERGRNNLSKNGGIMFPLLFN